jgi:hypothetical protein
MYAAFVTAAVVAVQQQSSIAVASSCMYVLLLCFLLPTAHTTICNSGSWGRMIAGFLPSSCNCSGRAYCRAAVAATSLFLTHQTH